MPLTTGYRRYNKTNKYKYKYRRKKAYAVPKKALNPTKNYNRTVTNANAINRIYGILRSKRDWDYYYSTFQGPQRLIGQTDYIQRYTVCQLAINYQRTFDSTGSAHVSQSALITKMRLHLRVFDNNSEEVAYVRWYLARPRKEQDFNPDETTWLPGSQFLVSDGLVILNPEMFKVIKSCRMICSPNSGTLITDPQRYTVGKEQNQFKTWTINWNYRPRATSGGWDSLVDTAIPYYKRLYLYAFLEDGLGFQSGLGPQVNCVSHLTLRSDYFT